MTNQERSQRVCPAERAGGLDNVFRRWLQNPDKILKDYIRTGMTVLDVGCGPGVFSIPMARMVGSSGKVIAADLQQEMLDKLKTKIVGTEFERIIRLHKTGSDSIGMVEKIDFALVFYMLHEVPSQEKFFVEIGSLLKPKAKVLLVEPKFHVSVKDFERSLETANRFGLKKTESPRIFFSRTALLENSR